MTSGNDDFAVASPGRYPQPTGHSPVSTTVEPYELDTRREGKLITMPEFLTTVLTGVAVALVEALLLRLAQSALSAVRTARAA